MNEYREVDYHKPLRFPAFFYAFIAMLCFIGFTSALFTLSHTPWTHLVVLCLLALGSLFVLVILMADIVMRNFWGYNAFFHRCSDGEIQLKILPRRMALTCESCAKNKRIVLKLPLGGIAHKLGRLQYSIDSLGNAGAWRFKPRYWNGAFTGVMGTGELGFDVHGGLSCTIQEVFDMLLGQKLAVDHRCPDHVFIDLRRKLVEANNKIEASEGVQELLEDISQNAYAARRAIFDAIVDIRKTTRFGHSIEGERIREELTRKLHLLLPKTSGNDELRAALEADLKEIEQLKERRNASLRK